jgi:hypothetical protein
MTLPNFSDFLAADQDSMNEIEEVIVVEDSITKRRCGPDHSLWIDFTDAVCDTQYNRRQREGQYSKHARKLAKSTSGCGGTRAGVDENVEAMALLS